MDLYAILDQPALREVRVEISKDLAQRLARLPYTDFNVHLSSGSDFLYPELDDGSVVSSGRWRRALVDALEWDLLQEIASFQLPRLEYVHMTLGMHSERNKMPWMGSDVGDRPLFLEHAPMFTTLSLRKTYDFPFRRLPFILPWSQLRAVRVANCPLQVCTELLHLCKALETFNWSDERWQQEIEDLDVLPDQRIVSNVRTMTLDLPTDSRGLTYLAVRNLLHWTVMPHLTHIEARFAPLRLMFLFIELSTCRLTSLSLTMPCSRSTSAQMVRRVLGALPGLLDLRIEYDMRCTPDGRIPDSETMEKFLEGFWDVLCSTQPPSESSGAVATLRYIPHLKKLTFRCIERCEGFLDAFVIRHRVDEAMDPASPCALREVWLETPLAKEDIERLRFLAENHEVELNGLSKCAEMYGTLLPYDWEGPRYSRQSQPGFGHET